MYRFWFERRLPDVYRPLLEGFAEIAGAASDTPDDPLSRLSGAHAIIAAARIQYNAALMDAVPSLRVIARTGIGLDNVDLPAATARGIAVCNVPDGPTRAVVEHTLLSILATARQLKRAEAMLRLGQAMDYFTVYQGELVEGKRLGLIGLGRIGRGVAKLALALGLRVRAYDPYLSGGPTVPGVEMASRLDEVLADADFVSLHVPLTPETRHLINAERLAQMKRGAILINTARGPIVDEAALIQALQSGHLGGAALDVFDPEPPAPDHPLLHMDNVIATPHIAGVSLTSKDYVWRMALTQCMQVLQGERPAFLVNPEVWSRRRP